MSEKKKQITNTIKIINKNIIFIDKKLAQLFNFMILDNKIKLDIESTKTFFNNIYNDYTLSMTTEHEIDIEGCASANTTTYGFLQSYNEKNKIISAILNDYDKIISTEKNNLVDYDHIDKSHVQKIIQINELLVINYINKITNEEAEKIFFLKLYFVEKLEYYDNFMKLYPAEGHLYVHIIFSIMIVFFVFIIKNLGMLIYNYIISNMQCNIYIPGLPNN
jgi:hypothetical protein